MSLCSGIRATNVALSRFSMSGIEAALLIDPAVYGKSFLTRHIGPFWAFFRL
jgi:hypothetical protein